MTYKTHIAGAIALTLILDTQLPLTPKQEILLYSSCVLGALMPDIDHPTSKINTYNPFASLIGNCIGHRTITHSFLGLFIFDLILYMVNLKSLILGFSIGYISHLLLDAMTVSGVPLLYPYKKKFRMMRLRTNTEHETIVLGLLVVFIGWFIFR